jgi:hypothetical protein
VKSARVLTNGRQFFGKQVTQAGDGYMDRTRAWAEAGGMDEPARQAIDRIFRDAGL